tara:strand:+ start:3946 stop:4233 length:288 start_codon:yes stop_codon:yes gene_type:complete
MNLTVDKLATIQGRMFALHAVIEDIEASVSTALRELEMSQPRHTHPDDIEITSFAMRVAEQIEIFSRVFTEIESSVEQTLDISANIENDIKEMTE